MTKTFATTATLALVAAFSTGGTAKADYYDHIHDLARTLEGQVRDLQGEFARHFRHTPQFRHLMSDAREMAELAEHIHHVTDEHGSPYHLQDDMRKLDRLFHHVEDLVEDIERAARYGHGHIHGFTWHVRRKLRAISNTLHHMEDDVNNLVRSIERRRYGGPRPVIVPPPRPRGVVINAGPFRFILSR